MYYDAFPSREIAPYNNDYARFALCVRDKADNLAHDEKALGSTEKCSLLVSPRFGAIRILIATEACLD